MNEREIEHLRKIYNDKIANGAFSGMISNQWVNCREELSLMELIQKALQVRIMIENLVGVHEDHPELADNPAIPEEFPITCTMCKKKTTVPFKPNAGWPVYCKACYMERNLKNE